MSKQNKTGFPQIFAAAVRGAAMELIHHAVRLRDVEMLRRELERGVDPDLRATDKIAAFAFHAGYY